MDLELEAYIAEHSEQEPPILAELNRTTHLNVMRPRMLSGNLQGAVFENVVWTDRCPSGIGDWYLYGICGDFNGNGGG